jgi:hypothetical protein
MHVNCACLSINTALFLPYRSKSRPCSALSTRHVVNVDHEKTLVVDLVTLYLHAPLTLRSCS